MHAVRLKSRFNRLCLAVCGGLVSANLAFAVAQDSRFEIRQDDVNVALDVQNVPRREALQRLLANPGIEFKWLNPSVANELITGTFNGTLSGIARQLLAQTDFVLVYERAAGTVRIARVLIVGRAQSGQTAARLAALEAAMQSPPMTPDPEGASAAPLPAARPNSGAGAQPLPFAGSMAGPQPTQPASIRSAASAAGTVSGPVPDPSGLTVPRPTSMGQPFSAPVVTAPTRPPPAAQGK
ncbi:MAG: hypothetical protein QOI12_649 [Alphaproteobacteria bacterium]|jgi:hypothetical protein|nr:hypothetical protein [Alphaproteobacteria bacterium]